MFAALFLFLSGAALLVSEPRGYVFVRELVPDGTMGWLRPAGCGFWPHWVFAAGAVVAVLGTFFSWKSMRSITQRQSTLSLRKVIRLAKLSVLLPLLFVFISAIQLAFWGITIGDEYLWGVCILD